MENTTVDEELESPEFHASFLQSLLVNDILEGKIECELTNITMADKAGITLEKMKEVLNDEPSSIQDLAVAARAVNRKLFARIVSEEEYEGLGIALKTLRRRK